MTVEEEEPSTGYGIKGARFWRVLLPLCGNLVVVPLFRTAKPGYPHGFNISLADAKLLRQEFTGEPHGDYLSCTATVPHYTCSAEHGFSCIM